MKTITFVSSVLISIASAQKDNSLIDSKIPVRVNCNVEKKKFIRLKQFKNGAISFMTESAKTGTNDCYTQLASDCTNPAGAQITYAADWAAMELIYPQITTDFCPMVTEKIGLLEDDIETGTADWIESPSKWSAHILGVLNKLDGDNVNSRCAISERDPAIIEYMQAMSYWKAQLIRMDAAKNAVGSQKLLLAESLKVYNLRRHELENDVKSLYNKLAAKHASFITLVKSDPPDYDGATEALLETGVDGARGIVEKIREKIGEKGEELEIYAQKLKRDSVRLAKMNQIANEKDRLDSFYNRIVEAGYQVLRDCMLNYQIEQAVN